MQAVTIKGNITVEEKQWYDLIDTASSRTCFDD
jgi:hypothetical protein